MTYNNNFLEKKTKKRKIFLLIKLIIIGLVLFVYYKEQFSEEKYEEKNKIISENTSNIQINIPKEKVNPQENLTKPLIEVTKKEEPPVSVEPVLTEVTSTKVSPAVETKLSLKLTEENAQGKKKIVLEYYNELDRPAEKILVLLKISENINISSEDFKKKKAGYVCEFNEVGPKESQKKVFFLSSEQTISYTIEIQEDQIKCKDIEIETKIKKILPLKLEISF